MFIYIFTIFIFFIFSYLEIRTTITEKEKSLLYSALFIALVVQVGLRWETGTDWNYYIENFSNTTSIENILINILIGFEIGYGFTVYFVRLFTDNYVYFLLFHAIVYYYLIFRASKRLSPFPILSLLLFYALTMGYLGSNRQLIALAICLYALRFVVERKPIIFFSLVFFAFLFHTSALLFAVYYFLNKDFQKKYVLGALFLAIAIGQTQIPNLLFSGIGNLLPGASAGKTDFYSNKDNFQDLSLTISGLIRRLLYFFLFFINYDTLSKKFEHYKLIFNGFLFGLIFYFLFSNSILIVVNRASLYFNVMECFLLASQLLLFNFARDRSYILFIIVLYAFFLFFQSIGSYPDLFLPYKGIFINSDFNRNLY